jgi:hypothetical protein
MIKLISKEGHAEHHFNEWWNDPILGNKRRSDRSKLTTKRMNNGFAKEMIAKKLENWEGSDTQIKYRNNLIEYNKNNHPKLRRDITLEKVIDSTKVLNTYRIGAIATYLNCSNSRVNKEVYSKFNSLRDFAESLGFQYSNHEVLEVIDLNTEEEVFDLMVPDYNNFAIQDQNGRFLFTHNSGKSTMAKLMLMYDIYKLCMMNDPAGFLGILGTKPFAFKIFNVHKYKAQDMVKEVNEIIDQSPFFKQEKKDKGSIINKISIGAAGDMKDIIGEDVVSVVLSELNFISADGVKAKNLIDQTISRIESRFQKGIGWLNHIILDSSDTTIDSPVEVFLKTHAAARGSLVYSTPIWVAKKQNYDFSETFSVYAGDSEIPAHIMKEDEDSTKYDKDRILSGIPKEKVLYDAFDANIELEKRQEFQTLFPTKEQLENARPATDK